MRIGEFAQKHGISQDTIRYYLDIGLLLAEKNGMQYKFSEADSKDLDKIIELKQLNFSLIEIEKILTFQRVSGTNTEIFRNLYLSFLEEKKTEVATELLKFNKINDYIKDKIHEMKTESLQERQLLGIPMSSLRIFTCPMCENYLDISEGTIERNMIIDAKIYCECGYKAVITHGVYIDESAVRTKLLNGKKMPTKEEYLASSPQNHMNFTYRGMASVIEYIRKYVKKPKYVLELDNCVGFLLLQYIKYLPPTTTYILIDYDKERITELKKNLEMYYEHKNFIFLCCDYDKLPIMKSSVDTIIDYGMVKSYAEETGEFLLERVLPLLRPEGILAMSYSHYPSKENAKLNLPPNLKEYLNKNRLMAKLSKLPLTPLEMIDIGPLVENHSFNDKGKAIERYQGTYVGKKTANAK